MTALSTITPAERAALEYALGRILALVDPQNGDVSLFPLDDDTDRDALLRNALRPFLISEVAAPIAAVLGGRAANEDWEPNFTQAELARDYVEESGHVS